MGTERDFVVKKGLKVAEGITLGGHTFNDIDIGSEHVDADDHIMSSGAIKAYVDANAGSGDAVLSATQTFSGVNTFSAVAKLSNGSVSAPALSFSAQTNQGIYRIGNGSTGITSSGQLKLTVDPYGITVGDGNSAGYVNAKGTQDLILRTNNGTNSSEIKMVDGADGDIDINTNGSGSLRINYDTTNNNNSLMVSSQSVNANPFSSTLESSGTNQVLTSGQFINGLNSGSRTTGFGTQIEFRLGELNYSGFLAGVIGAKMKDTGNANFDMFITPQGTGNLALGNFTLDADQSVGSGQDNYVMTYNHSAGTIGLEAAGGGGDSWGDEVDANIIPDTNNTYTLGSSSKKFGSAYFAGTSYNTLLSSANGSASYPTYTFEVDENTGMYRGGADTLGFSTGGTARLTIGSSGEVTIPGQMTSRANVVAATSGTTLTLAQTGSYVFWTNGSLTLPASGTVGTQYTIFNNTGGSATVQLNASNCSIVSGWPSVTATGDHEAVTFVCVTANNWIQIG